MTHALLPNDLVLVTGCTGFLGAWTVVLCLKAGARVRGTMRNAKKAQFLVDVVAKMGKSKDFELATLDLETSPESAWTEAMKGVDFVLHTASPFPAKTPSDENVLIRPAVEGTLRALRAADATDTVRRVVVTSSVASIAYGGSPNQEKALYDEDDWSHTEAGSTIAAYPKSKTLAERAAWKFFREERKRQSWTLSVVNPCAIIGPVLGPDAGEFWAGAERTRRGRETDDEF